MKKTTVQYVKLTLRFFKEEDQWIGECLETGISTYGDTIEEVQKELPDLIAMHFNAVEEMGDIGQYLKENQIKMVAAEIPDQVSINAPYLPGAIYEQYYKDIVIA